jgi:hypothetical protein
MHGTNIKPKLSLDFNNALSAPKSAVYHCGVSLKTFTVVVDMNETAHTSLYDWQFVAFSDMAVRM